MWGLRSTNTKWKIPDESLELSIIQISMSQRTWRCEDHRNYSRAFTSLHNKDVVNKSSFISLKCQKFPARFNRKSGRRHSFD
jgi:hypothetical protein